MDIQLITPPKPLAAFAILALVATTLPAQADNYKDDSGLFEYFNKQKIREQNDGIVLERKKGRKKGTSTSLSLFGKSADPLPGNNYRNNYSSRDWSKQPPTTILKFDINF